MPSGRSGHGVTVIQQDIFAFGGHDGSRYLDTACKYDVFEDQWSPLPRMPDARCYMAIASS